MTEWSSQDIDQFWGLTDDLTDAVSQWKTSANTEAAFYAALCVGHCDLFQVPQSIVPIANFAVGGVFVEVFYTAWREVGRISDLIVNEVEFDEGILNGTDEAEARMLALDLLQSRLLQEGLRKFFETLERSSNVAADKSATESFRQRFAVYRQQLEHLDELIDAHPEELALSSRSTWSHNVRMTLPENSWQPRPWWLTSHAERIFDDHQRFVQQLIDPGLAETIIANSVSSVVPLKRLPDGRRISENSTEFSLAADNRLAPAQFLLAEFRGEGLGHNLHSQIFMSADYRHWELGQVPDVVPIVGRISVIMDSKVRSIEDAEQLWRLRWGPIIADVQLRRLPSSLDLELLGKVEFTAGQLRKLVPDQDWPKQYWRRLG